MFYYLKSDFVEVTEPAGIIQNLSPYTIEVSTTNTEGSGDLLLPNQTYFFNTAPIYMRCIDGTAKTRVITAGNDSCCCNTNLLCPCCDGSGGSSGSGSGGGSGSGSGGGSGSGIEKIVIDGRTQKVDGTTATLDLSAYLKGHEAVTRAEVRALFD